MSKIKIAMVGGGNGLGISAFTLSHITGRQL